MDGVGCYDLGVLISFVGSPCSGKTTTAAMLFAALKEQGHVCDFITEQARSYIAKHRFAQGLGPNDPVQLSDEDQIHIMDAQLSLDRAFRFAVGDSGLVICDSTPLLGLMYMNPETRNDPRVKRIVEESVKTTDILFFCPAVSPPPGLDPNRVHTLEQSREVERNLFPVFQQHCPGIFSKVVPLKGLPTTRHSQAVGVILEKML